MREPTLPLLVASAPILFLLAAVAGSEAAELLIGGATTSITPDEPVALSGQFHTRIARTVETPVTATALALEARDGERVIDQAILVSCDLVAIRRGVQDKFRERVKPKLPGFDVRKLFLNATHTHTAPVMVEGKYPMPKEGVMQPAAYVDVLCGRLSEVLS